MTNAEVKQFINREVKGLWSRWEPTEVEIRLWMKKLRRYTYDTARAALEQVCCEQTSNYRRPILAHFLAKARRLAPPTAHGDGDPDTNVFIRCVEPPAGNATRRSVERPVYVLPRSQQHDPDYVRACAETMRRQSERLYGGRWITLIKKPPSPPEPPQAPRVSGPFFPSIPQAHCDDCARHTTPDVSNPKQKKGPDTLWPQHNERAPPS